MNSNSWDFNFMSKQTQFQQQYCDNLKKTVVEKANFFKKMARVAFYVIPHVRSRQLIEYICRQCEINLHSK
jgi:hypothetical protein